VATTAPDRSQSIANPVPHGDLVALVHSVPSNGLAPVRLELEITEACWWKTSPVAFRSCVA